MNTEHNINKEINLFAPQKKSNKTKCTLLSVLSVILVAAAAASFFPMLSGISNYAIAKGAPSTDAEKDQLINKTMQEAQQKLGDDFYKQATGGAKIPQNTAAQTLPKPVATTSAASAEKAQAAQPAKTAATAATTTSAPAKTAQAAKSVAKKEAPKSEADKMITVNVTNIGRTNPFVPAVDVPNYYDLGLPKPPSPLKSAQFPEPPTQLNIDDSAVKLMETTISGIMYDTFSPSAIIRVEGQDHLVKKGDRINGYKIVNITKDRVVVQNGTNVYRATVGETLSTQGGEIYFNTVDNLEQKFGGANAPADTTMIHIN